MEWWGTTLLLAAILLIAMGIGLAYHWRPVLVFVMVYLGVALFLSAAIFFSVDRWRAGYRGFVILFCGFAFMASVGYLMITHRRVREAQRRRAVQAMRLNARNN